MRVVVADRINPEGLTALIRDDRFEVVETHDRSEEERDAALAGAAALLVRSATQVDNALLSKAPELRVVGRAGVGVDNIDLDAATARGVAVLNAPSGNTLSAAELALALILSLVRNIPGADRSVRAGEWARARFAGNELNGKVLGLVGAGRIGGEVARRARIFGMSVRAYDPYLSDERAEELGVRSVELETLLAEADIVSLHVPLTEVTQGLIDADRLARMKKGSFLVNAARGGVVVESALAEALERGHLAGAALDVYEAEPLPEDSPLRDAPNLVLTPHLGASTAEAQERVAREIAEGVRNALLEGDLSRALNAPSIGGEELRRLRPLLALAQRLGRLGLALCPAGFDEVELRAAGEVEAALRPLAAAALHGFLEGVVGRDEVNFVSAPHIARSRGLRVVESRIPDRDDYVAWLEWVVRSDEGEVRVAGALLGEGHPRIVRIDDFRVSVLPEGHLLVLRNRDVPGVIGRVGTVLGEHGVNIAEYFQARREAGGAALAALSIDEPADDATLTALREVPEIESVRQVRLS